jgi:excisionase family DNA binding protein
MPRVTIQEASRILNVSQDVIRRDVRNGKLTATREGGSTGTRWMVDIPDNIDDYSDDFKEDIRALAQSLTPWWYDNPNKAGFVHYLESLGIEEVEPFFSMRR